MRRRAAMPRWCGSWRRRARSSAATAQPCPNGKTQHNSATRSRKDGEEMAGLKVLVVGGGIGGITTVLALRQRGIDVQLYEQAAAFGQVGAVSGFLKCRTDLLKLGLGEALRKSRPIRKAATIAAGTPASVSTTRRLVKKLKRISAHLLRGASRRIARRAAERPRPARVPARFAR